MDAELTTPGIIALQLRDQVMAHTVEQALKPDSDVKLIGYGAEHVKTLNQIRAEIDGGANLEIHEKMSDFVKTYKKV